MANEEIQVNLGLNTASFRTELEKSRAQAASFGSILKGGFSAIGIGLGVVTAAAIAFTKSAFAMGKELRNASEDIGVSTDFLQSYNEAAHRAGLEQEQAERSLTKLSQKIGEAREGNAEATQAFQKWGIALNNADGSLKNVEQIAGEVADRMSELSDASLRAAMSHDLMADKTGRVVGALRNLREIQKDGGIALKLSEHDVEALGLAESKLESLWELTKRIGAKVIAVPIKFLAGNQTLDATKPVAGNGEGESIDITTTKEYQSALEKRNKSQDELRKQSETREQRLKEIYAQQWEMLEKVNAAKDGSIEKLNAEADLAQSQIESTKEEADIKKQADADHLKSLETEKRFHEDVANYQKEYNRLARKQGEENFTENQRGSLYPTVQELAQNRGPFNRIAQQILNANRDQIAARAFGNIDRADADKDFANSRLDYLAQQGVIDPAEYERHKADVAAQDTADAIKELLDKAKNEGLNIKPVMAP